MISRISCHKNWSVLLQNLHHALIRYLISLLLCAVLYVITFAPSFISSSECAHLSPSTCKPLFMFLHLNLCCPSSNCISHAIIKCRMMILISYFPCLTARFFPHKDCSIRLLAPILPTFGSEITLSARMSTPSCASSPRCTFTLTRKVAVPAAILFRNISMAAAWYPRQVPPPTLPFHLHQSTYWLLSTMTDCHTNTATAPLSAYHEAPGKTLPIQADLSWSPLPFISLCTAAFSFSSQVIISCSHFDLFVWTVTCRYLALKPIASKHDYLCAQPALAFSPFKSYLTFVLSS